MITIQVQRIQVLYTVASNTPGTTLATVRAETPVAEPLEGERAISQSGSLGTYRGTLNFKFRRILFSGFLKYFFLNNDIEK